MGSIPDLRSGPEEGGGDGRCHGGRVPCHVSHDISVTSPRVS